MGMKFTPEQQRVIELHNSNILVSAAAGSGKTAVLVERIIRMICDGEHPADIDRLLIVTFTNAAAAEMRERIAAGITARLETDPGNEHIQKQSALLHNAQITTIDSFSLFLIRNHFNEIGLDRGRRGRDQAASAGSTGAAVRGCLCRAICPGSPGTVPCLCGVFLPGRQGERIRAAYPESVPVCGKFSLACRMAGGAQK